MPKIPARERDAFYEERRAELARVALGLWAERGYDQTSVAQIASGAGVSKGTFYLYFESKKALLEDVMRRNSLVPQVRELIGDLGNRSLDEAIHRFVRGAWQHLCEHRELVLVAIRELPTHLEQARWLVERVMVPANRLFAGYLEKQVDSTRAEQLSLVISARGLLGMLLFVFLTQEVLGAGRTLPVPEEQVTATIAELFLHGIEMRAPGESHGC